MRRGSWLLVVAAFSISCGSSVNVAREQSLLLEVDRQWSQSTRDVDKFVSYYAADASVYPQGMPLVKGSGPIREMYKKMVSSPGFSLKFTPTSATVSTAGDLGYTSGTYEMTMNEASGAASAERGKYVAVWKKAAGGQWKVAEDIFNSNAPPPAPAPSVAPTPAPKPTASKAKAATKGKKTASRKRR
jgi:ketosteroid isomerase-like protein